MDKREQDRLRAAKYRESNRESYNSKMREWNAANKERINEARRERRRLDEEYAEKVRQRDRDRPQSQRKNTRLKRSYGLDLKQYHEIYAAQECRCAICGSEKELGGLYGLAVDHCHKTGEVRELLCPNCNHALGKFNDDVSILEKAIAYLNKHKKE